MHHGIIVWKLLATGFTLLKYFSVITIEHEAHYDWLKKEGDVQY